LILGGPIKVVTEMSAFFVPAIYPSWERARNIGAGSPKLFVIVIWFVPIGRSDALIHVAHSTTMDV
jgi:hypothetical protein